MSRLREVAVAPIQGYRRVVSPLLPARCKFAPSCSTYAVQAVRRFGIVRGMLLAGWRLLRCNPWSHGGFDPIEDQSLFSGARRSRVPRGERGAER